MKDRATKWCIPVFALWACVGCGETRDSNYTEKMSLTESLNSDDPNRKMWASSFIESKGGPSASSVRTFEGVETWNKEKSEFIKWIDKYGGSLEELDKEYIRFVSRQSPYFLPREGK